MAQVSAKASTAVATEAVEAGAQYLLLEPKWLRIKERVQGCVADDSNRLYLGLIIPTDFTWTLVVDWALPLAFLRSACGRV